MLNETADYYRYFDATAHAEFLYESVAQTVEHDLPDEVRFLEAFDRFAAGVKDILEMPDRQVERLRGFLQQGGGRLSKRAREQSSRRSPMPRPSVSSPVRPLVQSPGIAEI